MLSDCVCSKYDLCASAMNVLKSMIVYCENGNQTTNLSIDRQQKWFGKNSWHKKFSFK